MTITAPARRGCLSYFCHVILTALNDLSVIILPSCQIRQRFVLFDPTEWLVYFNEKHCLSQIPDLQISGSTCFYNCRSKLVNQWMTVVRTGQYCTNLVVPKQFCLHKFDEFLPFPVDTLVIFFHCFSCLSIDQFFRLETFL